MTTALHYPSPLASLPDAQFTWLDHDGTPIDFTSGYLFRVTVGRPPEPAVITKTSNIIGSASSTMRDPNLTVVWQPNELSVLTPGIWYFQITATEINSGGKQRILSGSLKIDSPAIV